MAPPPPETRPAAVSNSPSVMMNFMMGSTEARFKGSFFEGSAEQQHEEEAQHFSLKVGRYHTFVAGLYAKIIGYRDGIQADSSVVTFYEVECLKEGKEYTIEKRYSEFFSFNESVSPQVGGLISPFPPKITSFKNAVKTAIGQNSEQSAMRMNMINAWLAELLRKPLTISAKAQVDSFFEVHTHVDVYNKRSTMKREEPGRLRFEGYVMKMTGNKDDPYNNEKGFWKKRYLVLMDNLQYFSDERTFKRGGVPKGIANLDSFFVTRETYGIEVPGQVGKTPIGFTIHASPLPFICRTDEPSATEAWISALRNFSYAGERLSTSMIAPPLPPTSAGNPSQNPSTLNADHGDAGSDTQRGLSAGATSSSALLERLSTVNESTHNSDL